MAEIKGCTASQLALAWVLAQGPDVIPIPGTKKLNYLDENMGALKVELSGEELARMDAILPAGRTAGDRYQPHALQYVNG